ncbi:MAG: hypothetical protein RR424_00665 [Oscillospiraceae bacterium]
MSLPKYSRRILSALFFTFIIYMIISVLLQPQAACKGVINGLLICYNKLIPSLFPFLILSSLLMSHPYAKYLGFMFYPYLKLMRIHNKKSAVCILLGTIGGFAVGASMITSLFEQGDVNKREAELLLCCVVGTGPAFVIGVVGFGLFGNVELGIILFLSLVTASLISGIICNAFYHNSAKNIVLSASALQYNNKDFSITSIITKSTVTMLSLCGFIVSFSCFLSLVCSADASPIVRYIICAFTEVTQGCIAAMNCSQNKIYLICASLSLIGLCAFMQIRSICSKELSLLPLLLSRIIHLPISLMLLTISIKLINPKINTALTETVNRAYFRLPADTMLFLFLFSLVVIYDLDLSCKKHLHKPCKNV